MCSMAQEDHTLRCNNSTRLSKKSKKVPQRGMGVAQLEKLILEEQQKKGVGVVTPNSPVIPLPPSLPPNSRPLITRSDAISRVFVTKPMNSGSGGIDGNNNFSRLWTCRENPNPNQNRALDHRGYVATMPTNLGSLPYESSALVWPTVPRSHYQQPSTSSMANVSLGTTSTSSSSSSVMNCQTMELPSNQSYYGNKYSPWPDGQKMVGMKRSYQYLVDNVPIPSFNCKFPSAYVSPITRYDESTSCSNGCTTSLKPMAPNFREKPPSQGTIADKKTKKLLENNCDLTKDFLTLAPSRASPQSRSSSKEKGQTKDPSAVEWSNHHQLHNFFPAVKTNGSNNDDAVEHVDLSLKL